MRYGHCWTCFHRTVCFMFKGIFNSFSWYQTHYRVSQMHRLNNCLQFELMHVIIELRTNNRPELIWPQFWLANPCQNEESKQKKHDKRNKRNGNECLFNTWIYSETWQTPLTHIKPLESYSAQINSDIIIWNGSCLVVHGQSHLVTGVKRKRINSPPPQCTLFLINHFIFQKKLTWFMGFTILWNRTV